jgi:ATP-dependent Clp protease ATP-binding subunit ClpA
VDAANLPFFDNSFDRVLHMCLLHHVLEPEKVLEEMRRDQEDELKMNRIVVKPEDVKYVISVKTGVPAENFTDDEGERLLNMNKELKLSIIGQDNAVEKISKCINLVLNF